MKKCSSTLIIREMQIKTTLKHHLMPVRMAITKNSGINRCWRRCKEIGMLSTDHRGKKEIEMLFYCWWECKLVQPLWKTVW